MEMTEYKRAFCDTAIFIYYLDKNEQFFDKTKKLFADSLREGLEIVTSTCDVFYTNDKQLLQIEELNVVVL